MTKPNSDNPEPTLSVIVPTYNEEKRIVKTLKAINQFFAKKAISFEILVVDDGSRDKTAQVVEELAIAQLRFLSYGRNRGKGYAINYGVKHAQADWILFTDADNSTPIEEFDKLWPESTNYKIIIGSRYLPESHIAVPQPTPRVILSRLGNLLVQFLILPGIKDTQCGFKLFQRSAAKVIFARQTIWGWGFDMEILRIAKELGIKIKEVPINWYNDDQSRIQSSRVFFKTLSELFAIKRKSLLGAYKHKNQLSV